MSTLIVTMECMREGLSDEEQQAWRSFVEMRHLLERHLAGHLQREFGLSDSDYEVLVNLSEAPAGRLRAFELGERTQWEKSRMSHHLSRMEKRGLVRRERSGGRYPDVVLTEHGRTAIESSAPANAARVRELFVDVLGPERLGQLRDMSCDVIAAIRRHMATDCVSEAGSPHS